jgi:molybdopterin converting factor small subunit
LNNENLRDLNTDEIVLSEQDEIHVIPAMAGG